MTNAAYTDYVGNLFFKACRIINAKFTKKVVRVGDEDVVLCHCSGVNLQDGSMVNFDMWPRNSATAEDLASLPDTWDDVIFRIGFYEKLDEETGEIATVQGAPKWIACKHSGKDYEPLHGERREFQA